MGKPLEIPHSTAQMVDWIVDRMHVGTSDRTVIRTLRARMKKVKESFPRPVRHAVYRRALETHNRNRELYAYVMGGMS